MFCSTRSETDYGGDDVVFHAPRPRHYSATSIQPWLQVLDHHEIPRSPSPSPIIQTNNRVSSPLRRHPSVPQEGGVALDALAYDSLPAPSSPTTSTITSTSRIKGAALPLREFPDMSREARPSTLHGSRMDSPARRWVRWMGKMGLKNALLPSIVFVSLATRWLVGLGGYSGLCISCVRLHASFISTVMPNLNTDLIRCCYV